MNESTTKYQSYLLRLWRPDRKAGWRIMVESVNSGERQTFTDLPSLVEFLETQTNGNNGFSRRLGK